MRVIGGLENLVDEQNHIPLTVGEEKRIPFDVSDAGPGNYLIILKIFARFSLLKVLIFLRNFMQIYIIVYFFSIHIHEVFHVG